MAWGHSRGGTAFDAAFQGKGGAGSYIDITYTVLEEKPVHAPINTSSLFGAVSFLSMLAAPAAVEGGAYITALALVAVMAMCAFLSMKEDGKIK